MIFCHFRLVGVLDGPVEEPVYWYEDRENLFQKRCNILQSLCMTCKSLCRVAQPLLYEVIKCLNSRHHRWHFLRTLVNQPELGKAVKEVHLRYEGETPERGLGKLAPEVMEAAKSVDIEMSRAFMRALETGRSEAQIALAMALMPNLGYINFCLEERFIEDYNWMFRLLRNSTFNLTHKNNSSSGADDTTPTVPFANIKRIETSYGGTQFGYNPLFISEFAALPHLQQIMIKSAWSDERSCGLSSWDPAPGISSITHINLDASSVTNDFVRKLLRACRAPKTFIYSWGGAPPTDTMHAFGDFMDALRTRAESLETIRLDVVLKANYFESLAIENEYLPPIGSFKAFKRLTELEIPGHLLLGSPLLDWEHFDGEHWPAFTAQLDYAALTDVFPRSLRRLIVDCMGLEEDVTFILPLLDELAATCAERLPDLKFVKLIVVDENDFSLLEGVKKALERQGVEVQVKDFIDEEGWEDDMEVRYGEDGRKKITSRLIGDILHMWPHMVAQN
ncbi:hypothetical protein MPH_05618 [Macrophomina phaseolina MS6]|uniref:Leucine-rich repeat domain-containing protein n=1 Tax=Macrophomina phaseolina (strain MS6) TaxID=1126212 RepID=K2S3S7_MACPH|nr:hypothetical protein MPH_05618 [Macrophomina phaseolina MS6]